MDFLFPYSKAVQKARNVALEKFGSHQIFLSIYAKRPYRSTISDQLWGHASHFIRESYRQVSLEQLKQAKRHDAAEIGEICYDPRRRQLALKWAGAHFTAIYSYYAVAWGYGWPFPKKIGGI